MEAERDHSASLQQPDSCFRDQHLGNTTAGSLASWVTANPEASWDDFKQSFLSRNPGKPPQVTRASWKAISMRTCGTYHAYLQEFNRQKALISTGADEVVEQFLSGLTVQLKGQVEFLKNRNWQADEFDELVKATTERVNSSVSSTSTAAETRESPQPVKQNKRTHSHMNAGPSQQPLHAGEMADNAATAAYCLDKGLCNSCKRLGHNSANCKYAHRVFRIPRNWDESYWQERARLSAMDRAPGPPLPRPFDKFQKKSKK